MKFQCMQEDFSRALQVVSRAVATRSTLPVLSGIYFELDSARLRCLGTDLEIGIETSIPVTAVEGNGNFVLPGKTIADLVRKLSTEIVKMEISETANQSWQIRFSLEFDVCFRLPLQSVPERRDHLDINRCVLKRRDSPHQFRYAAQ